MSKLTRITANKVVGTTLTKKTEIPFVVSFRRKLIDGYRLSDLEKKDVRQLQKFLDIASELSVQQMDEAYSRPTDSNDKFNGQQVQHYGVGDCFRIHGVFENQRFEVIRIDPNHRKHR